MNLKPVLEGLLFLAGDEGLSSEQLSSVLEISMDEFDRLIKELISDYDKDDRGLKIVYFASKYKFVTKSEYSSYFKKLFNEEINTKLSSAALEVLAIIAYNQPVTRLMVDEIRGVSSVYNIKKLLFLNFVKEVGRSELPGKPILYGVTDEFLDYFGLNSLNELPKIDVEGVIEDEDLFSLKYNDE